MIAHVRGYFAVDGPGAVIPQWFEIPVWPHRPVHGFPHCELLGRAALAAQHFLETAHGAHADGRLADPLTMLPMIPHPEPLGDDPFMVGFGHERVGVRVDVDQTVAAE